MNRPATWPGCGLEPFKTLGLALLFLALLATPAIPAAAAETQRLSVVIGGQKHGELVARIDGDTTTIDYAYTNNGRGPTIKETLRLDADGLPVDWTIAGKDAFGAEIDEGFRRDGRHAEWHDSGGPASATVDGPALYVDQGGSPWSAGVIARALLRAPGQALPALPGGTLRLQRRDTLTLQGAGGPVEVIRYEISGTDLTPWSVLLDGNGRLFAHAGELAVFIRPGYEGEFDHLRTLASTWNAQRLAQLQQRHGHRYTAPVRIRNVRLFDPRTSALTGPVQVLVSGHQIAAVEPPDSPATPGEVTIDGEGGTLVAGMTDTHEHLSQDELLLDVLAGITTVRDMGNDNAALDQLVARVDSGEIGGPRVVRSGFIEGKRPDSAQYGFVVDSQAAALDAVRWYAARGYWQIKLYSRVDPDWVPAIIEQAHALGLRVAGHVPAVSTADAMIAASYDEIVHIVQLTDGWVVRPGEDLGVQSTRMAVVLRLPGLDLDSAPVRKTLDTMAARHIAIDPTMSLAETLTLSRDGQVPPGAVDVIDHLPVGAQRRLKRALLPGASAPEKDAAYRGIWDQWVATLARANDRGILIVPGTDSGGSFAYHRELELYQLAGMTPAQIVKRATWDTAVYLGQDQRLGSIAKGKLADFFLVPGDPTRDLKAIKAIRMVVKDGTFYFPDQLYPEFGIAPFSTAPKVVEPAPHPAATAK